MDKEKSHIIFIFAITAMARVISVISDKFFVQKFNQKLAELVTASIAFLLNRRESMKEKEMTAENVAQYKITKQNLLNGIENSLELLDYFYHGKTISRSPLLIARIRLLQLQLFLIKTQSESAISGAEKRAQRRHKSDSSTVVLKHDRTQKQPVLNQSQEKIFNFIQTSGDVRTKQIIDEFSIFSQRTVKRNLKDLVRHGLIQRRAEHNAVYYSPTESI